MSDNVAKNGLRQRRSIFLPLLLVVITVLGNFVNDIAQGCSAGRRSPSGSWYWNSR